MCPHFYLEQCCSPNVWHTNQGNRWWLYNENISVFPKCIFLLLLRAFPSHPLPHSPYIPHYCVLHIHSTSSRTHTEISWIGFVLCLCFLRPTAQGLSFSHRESRDSKSTIEMRRDSVQSSRFLHGSSVSVWSKIAVRLGQQMCGK